MAPFASDGDGLLTGVLPQLDQILLVGQLISFSEQISDRSCIQMHMPIGHAHGEKQFPRFAILLGQQSLPYPRFQFGLVHTRSLSAKQFCCGYQSMLCLLCVII